MSTINGGMAELERERIVSVLRVWLERVVCIWQTTATHEPKHLEALIGAITFWYHFSQRFFIGESEVTVREQRRSHLFRVK